MRGPARVRTAPREPAEPLLVGAAIAGDLEAYAALAARHRPAASALARDLARPGDAEAAVLDALTMAYQVLPLIPDPSEFRAWLLSIVRFRARRGASREPGPRLPALGRPAERRARAV